MGTTFMGLPLTVGTLVAIMLAVIILWALLVIGHWNMFQKAGEKGWKSLVPIYCDYIVFKLVWNVRGFFIYLVLMVMVTVTTTYSMQGNSSMFLNVATWVSSFAMTVWAIIASAKTALAFGKGPLYAFGMVLLPSIFAAIIGLGKSEYIGPQ